MIKNVTQQDIKQICEIYNHYVENTVITFEEERVSLAEMKRRVNQISASYPFIVYKDNANVIGYAYASKFRKKSAYRFTVESTIYLAPESRKKGIGTKLYRSLIDKIKDYNFHAIIGVITIPNKGSQKLHKNLGFERVARLSEAGYKFDKWIDVEYWELTMD